MLSSIVWGDVYVCENGMSGLGFHLFLTHFHFHYCLFSVNCVCSTCSLNCACFLCISSNCSSIVCAAFCNCIALANGSLLGLGCLYICKEKVASEKWAGISQSRAPFPARSIYQRWLLSADCSLFTINVMNGKRCQKVPTVLLSLSAGRRAGQSAAAAKAKAHSRALFRCTVARAICQWPYCVCA